jgi:hypothetical protein
MLDGDGVVLVVVRVVAVLVGVLGAWTVTVRVGAAVAFVFFGFRVALLSETNSVLAPADV